MRIVVFCHSIISDWNHRDAHFFRGIVSALSARGHDVSVYEPAAGWSIVHLLHDHGVDPIRRLNTAYPGLDSTPFDLDRLDLDAVLDGADLVLVHEWNDPALVKMIGAHHAKNRDYTLFFHDTQLRPRNDFDLRDYDAALAINETLRDLYQRHGWAKRTFVWRDAVDTRVFKPHPGPTKQHDLIWFGRAETSELLLGPVRALGLDAHAYGPRFREEEIRACANAGIKYQGWIPNYDLPRTLASYKVAVHIPPKTIASRERSVPTIPVLEALACGIPLIAAPAISHDGLFDAGADIMIAADAEDMTRKIQLLLSDRELAAHMAWKGLETVRTRHTSSHRVEELLAIHRRVRADVLRTQDVPVLTSLARPALDLATQAP